ncbi:hypothetical protein BJ742DRAFT_793886 [Cladochytrium replicatum]|nr:hypothetical protein BJ742DRAFT_793886 [Cladochytrium replicatum]
MAQQTSDLKPAPKREFSTSFWGEHDLGLEVVWGRLRQGKHICNELLTLVKERAAIEEDYGKRLAKVAKAFVTKEEMGTMKDSLEVLRTEMENTARAHLNLATELRTQLEKPVSDFIAHQSSTRKNHAAMLDKDLKAKSAQMAAVSKAKERYEAKCAEADGLLVQMRPTLQPKEADKLRARHEKTVAAAKSADSEYKSGIEKFGELSKKWETNFRAACTVAQKLEENRLENMREFIWNFVNMISSTCVADDECCERVRVSLESVEIDKDIQLFIDTRSTGTELPALLVYVPYTSKSMDNDYIPLSNPPSSAPSVRSSLENKVSSTPLGSLTKVASHLRTGSVSEPGDAPVSNGSMRFQPSSLNRNGAVPDHLSESEEVYTTEPYNIYDIPANPVFVAQVRVLYDYKAQADEELTITKGQNIPVLVMHEDG